MSSSTVKNARRRRLGVPVPKAVRVRWLDRFLVRAFALKSEKQFLLALQKQKRSIGNDGLRKVLNATDLVVIGIGGIVGAGVFVLTGTAAKENAGPALVVSYVTRFA